VKQSNQSGLTRFLNYIKETLFECLYNVFTVHLFNDVFDAVNTSKRNTLLFARGRHANYKCYVGLNIVYKQYMIA